MENKESWFFWIEANVVLPNCCTSLKGRETEVLQAPLILYLVNLRILLQARYVRRREGDSVYDKFPVFKEKKCSY